MDALVLCVEHHLISPGDILFADVSSVDGLVMLSALDQAPFSRHLFVFRGVRVRTLSFRG